MMPHLATMTPQYVENVLRGALTGSHVQQWELFDLMFDTWPELSACQQELTEGVLQSKLTIEAYAEEGEAPTDEAMNRQKLVSAAVRKMTPDAAADENDMDGTLKDILDGWFRGVTALEIGWHQVDAGTLGPIIAPRCTWWAHPSNFAWSNSGLLELQTQHGGMPFPPHKFLLGIHKAKSGSPLGGALLRPLAWWWCAANFSADWLLNLAQLFGMPFRWANYDPNAPQATVDAICNMLQNMGTAAWAAFPAGTTMEMKHESVSADHSPQGELLDRADRYARLLILGQTMSGGQDSSKGGGKAFGSVEAEVKQRRIEAAGKYACSVISNQLIPAILHLNYGDATAAPVACLLADNEGSLEEAQRDEILSRIMPLSIPHLRKKYKLPEPADDEEVTKLGAAPAVIPDDHDPKWEDSNDGPLAAKLAALQAITDDALFAKELQALAESL